MRGETLGSGDFDSAAALREAFDASFAQAPRVADRTPVDFLAVRIAGDSFAMRLSETAGLFADRKVMPVPTTVANFLGVSGFRGVLVPVYDLGAVLGYPPSSAGRWLVLVAGGALAFAFDVFDGHIRVASDGITARRDDRSARQVHEIARQGDSAWPVIDVPAAVESIRARLPRSTTSKE